MCCFFLIYCQKSCFILVFSLLIYGKRRREYVCCGRGVGTLRRGNESQLTEPPGQWFYTFITWTFPLPFHLVLRAVCAASCCYGSLYISGCFLGLDVTRLILKWCVYVAETNKQLIENLFFVGTWGIMQHILMGMLDSCQRHQTFCKLMVKITSSQFIFKPSVWFIHHSKLSRNKSQ